METFLSERLMYFNNFLLTIVKNPYIMFIIYPTVNQCNKQTVNNGIKYDLAQYKLVKSIFMEINIEHFKLIQHIHIFQ